MTAIDSSLITTRSVREYFCDALTTAARNQDVALHESTCAYVTNLLTTYCHTTALAPVSDDGRHHKALAQLYAEALAADGLEQRSQALQRLGDIALFIAGIFTDSLSRKLVDVDYYIGMGETAYGSLHETMQRRRDRFARAELFEELQLKFVVLVDLLSEISETSGLKSNANTLRAYEIWMRTGSERARRQLARSGIVPIVGSAAPTRH